MHEDTQIVFVDTPGIFAAKDKNKMERAIVANAWESLTNADVILVLVDIQKKLSDETRMILSRLKDYKKPVHLVMNKIDGIKRETLLQTAQKLNEEFDFSATYMISALKGDGVDGLKAQVAKSMPESPYIFDPEDVSDMPMRLLAAEMTREKLFHKLYREIPYDLTVETDAWEDNEDGSVTIHQTIYVMRESQKKIILGKGGDMIKHVGIAARKDIEEMIDARAHLKLFVKVKQDWTRDEERFRLWGLNPSA
jgi:GTP-binding protein Era